MTQRPRHPIADRQGVKLAIDTAEQRAFFGTAAWVSQMFVTAVAFQPQECTQPSLAQMPAGFADRDGLEPASHRRGILNRAQTAHRVEEYFLNHVINLVISPEHTQDDSRHKTGMLDEQALDGERSCVDRQRVIRNRGFTGWWRTDPKVGSAGRHRYRHSGLGGGNRLSKPGRSAEIGKDRCAARRYRQMPGPVAAVPNTSVHMPMVQAGVPPFVQI